MSIYGYVCLCMSICVGSNLLLYLPQVVIHELDISSPLVPSAIWATASKLYYYNFNFNEEEAVNSETSPNPGKPSSDISPANSAIPTFPEFCPRSARKLHSSVDGKESASPNSSDMGTPPPALKSSKSPNLNVQKGERQYI